MGLNEYKVASDKFEVDERLGGFAFPCNACIHRHKAQFADPCGSCGHNMNAVLKEKNDHEHAE